MGWLPQFLACACLASAGSTGALGATTLHSADTIIALDAGKESPRVTQLSMKAGALWKGEAGEPLIDHVEIGGQEQPLHWKFNETASASGSTWARFVYDSGTPRLRVFWEWRVRAAHGPIEHSIRIQNLSGESLWIPLQNSLQLNWRIPANEHLGQLWVEKGAGRPICGRNSLHSGQQRLQLDWNIEYLCSSCGRTTARDDSLRAGGSSGCGRERLVHRH